MKMNNTNSRYVSESRFGMFIENINDQFERVIEVIETLTAPITLIAQRVERLEKDMANVKLTMAVIGEDVQIIKLRLDKTDERLDLLQNTVTGISHRLDGHEKRIRRLEAARA